MKGSSAEFHMELTLLSSLGVLLSSGGDRASLSILIYHRVLNAPDPMLPGIVDAAIFNWQMALLARHFNVLPLSVGVKKLRQGCLPARAICVTFDDGYTDNVEIALPILQVRGLPATFFIATGYLDGGRMWNDTVIEMLRCVPLGRLDLSEQGLGSYYLKNIQDRVATADRIIALLKYLPFSEREEKTHYLASLAPSSLPNKLMLTSQQVRELHTAGMEIGAHTVNHPILARLNKEAAWSEIAEGKEYLETLLGERVKLFAYPNGRPGSDYLPEHVDMVRKLGFDSAVSTRWGVAAMWTDPWQLPRFTPWDTSPGRFMARLLWNYRLIS